MWVFRPTSLIPTNSDVGDKKHDICVAGVALNEPDGTETHVMFDAMIRRCGWNGHQSATIIEVNGVRHRPYCAWMGEDSENSLQVHLASFRTNASALAYEADEDLLCRSIPRAMAAFTRGGKHKEYQAVPFFSPPVDAPPESAEADVAAGKLDPAKILDKDTSINPANWRWNYSPALHCHKEMSCHFKGGGADRDYTKPFPAHDRVIQQNNARLDRIDFGPGIVTRPDVFKRAAYEPHAITLKSRDEYILSSSSDIRMSALDACSRNNIVGKDIANSLEQLYCDLETRTLFPFCQKEGEIECFDLVAKQVRTAGLVVSEKMAAWYSPFLSLFRGDSSSADEAKEEVVVRQLQREHDFGDV